MSSTKTTIAYSISNKFENKIFKLQIRYIAYLSCIYRLSHKFQTYIHNIPDKLIEKFQKKFNTFVIVLKVAHDIYSNTYKKDSKTKTSKKLSKITTLFISETLYTIKKNITFIYTQIRK